MDPKVVDLEAFGQILTLDYEEDDNNHAFTKTVILKYFDQALITIKEMREALYELKINSSYARENQDYSKFRGLGRLLKSTASQLGLIKVQAAGKAIQLSEDTMGFKAHDCMISKIEDAYLESSLVLKAFYHL
jgi:hypothetical protein